MKAKKLNTKYTPSELADSFVFRNSLTDKQKEESRNQLTEARKKNRLHVTERETLHARVLQLRYQMEDYAKSSQFNEHLSFAYFLRNYIKLKYKVNKDFAKDINIDETELSLILNKHRYPSEKTIIRLELHSNKMISALNY